MKRLILPIIASLLAAASTGQAQLLGPGSADRSEQMAPPGLVTEIIFQGNHALSTPELETITATKVTGFFSRFFFSINHSLGTPYQTLDIPTLQRDTAQLNLYYKDHGYLTARATYRYRPNHDDLQAYNEYIRKERLMKGPPGSKDDNPIPPIHDTVWFSIKEGPPFTISRITLSGLETLPNEFQPELTEHVTIKRGEQWSRAVAAKEIERLSGIMVENGYPNFRFDSMSVENTRGKTEVNASLYFTPGHRYRYGAVNIVWDTATAEPSHVARNAILAQLYADSGRWFKLSEVERSESNLAKLGTFDFYRVALDTGYINKLPDSLRDSAAVPVIVFLRMKLRGEIPVGLFGGTGIQGFVAGGNVGYVNRNLTQIADNFNFQLSIQPLPTSQRRYSANLDYQMPYIGLGRIPLNSGIGVSRQTQFRVQTDTSIRPYDQQSYSIHSGSSIILSRTDNRTTLTPDMLAEYIFTDGDSIVLSHSPQKQINLLPSIGYQDDRTNDPLNPTAGNYKSISFEWGIPSRLINGNPSSAYWKVVPQFKFYTDLSNSGKMVIAARLQFGASYLTHDWDAQTIPSLNHRFFGGGATSNRGWPDQGLIVSKDTTWPSNLGGFNDLEGSLELRFAPFQYGEEFTSWQKFSSPLRFVLFYDIGNVWDNVFWRDPLSRSFSKLAMSTGFGLRYNLFFGALRADVGFKLYDPAAGTNDFRTGGETIVPGDSGRWLSGNPFRVDRTMNFHFGIGQAF